MRPLRLEIEGFTAFRQPVCLDLSDLDLFAITGPTGAGKSSLIDAISYALYGRVPRVTNEVASLITNDRATDRMRVVLEFQAGEERYRVFRETRRKGQPNVRLDRWRDGDWQPLLDRAREVTDRITEIVGLDYEGFTRSVLLPQGQFQEFLAGSAEKRRAVLGSLLRLDVYDRMRRRATTLAMEAKARLDAQQQTLDALAEATPENLKRLEGELAASRAAAGRLRAESQALARALELAQAYTSAGEALAAAEADAAQTRRDLSKTATLIEEGDAALTNAAAGIEDLQGRLAANPYDPDRLTRLTLARDRAAGLEKALHQHKEAETSHKNAGRESAAAQKAVDAAAARLAGLEAATALAAAALEEARRHNLVAALAGGLKPGDACPVCGGTLGELPSFNDADLAAAERAHVTARKAESEARSAHQNAANAATRATMLAETSTRRLAELAAEREQLEQALRESLDGEASSSLDAIDAALRQQASAREQRDRLSAELADATARRDALQAQLSQARSLLAGLESRAGDAEASVADLTRRFAETREEVAALAEQEEWSDVAAALQDRTGVSALLRRRAAATQQAELDATRTVGQMETRLERLKADLDRVKTLQRDLAALKKEHDVAADLAQMLRADRFQAFIQQEALATLAADGSRRLEQLSGGRYRLQVDEKGQEFEVIDQWNADAARSVRTLSGGETFLASLALSLALAESLPSLAASRRVVLDSVFLDEGFGSLDPEALDRAAAALDALRDESRMVCIVTHLQELAQRLPARVVVTKTESGSTVAIA